MKACSICQRQFAGMGNNAQPVNDGRCCDECNREIVTRARIVIAMRGNNHPLAKPMFTGRKMLGPKRKSQAGAPGSLDTTKSPAERDALRNKGE